MRKGDHARIVSYPGRQDIVGMVVTLTRRVEGYWRVRLIGEDPDRGYYLADEELQPLSRKVTT